MRSMLLGVAETGLELSPQATEGLFLSCEFYNPSASRCSAPPFTQGRRKIVIVAFAIVVQICKCQTFQRAFSPASTMPLYDLCKPPALPVVMTFGKRKSYFPIDERNTQNTKKLGRTELFAFYTSVLFLTFFFMRRTSASIFGVSRRTFTFDSR